MTPWVSGSQLPFGVRLFSYAFPLTYFCHACREINIYSGDIVSVTSDLLLLVHRLANNGDVAGGQLAVFQGASEAPISESYGSSEQRGKQPSGPGPEGCVENGPAAALLVGYVSIRYAPSSRLADGPF